MKQKAKLRILLRYSSTPGTGARLLSLASPKTRQTCEPRAGSFC